LTINRLVFAVLAFALVVAACAERGGDSLAPTSSEETTPEAASSPSVEHETNGAGTFTYEVWFAGSEGFLFVSKRTAKLEPAVARARLQGLSSSHSGRESHHRRAGERPRDGLRHRQRVRSHREPADPERSRPRDRSDAYHGHVWIGLQGDYSVTVPYEVDREQSAVIEAFESSAEDGRAINLVRIPVTLTP
jgi:hypothetical protein